MKKIVLFLCIAISVTGFSKNLFVSHPSVSPDGKQIIFCFKGDLWTVNTEGGSALRLTAMEGIESNPAVSPDGQYLAFSSNAEGNNDVYVMPLKGGPIRKLTYHSGSDTVCSWSLDSEHIYFTSNRENDFTAFKISLKGGTPVRLLNGYFNNIHETVEKPGSSEIFFTDTWESNRFKTRKRYKGAYNPDIKSYNLKNDIFIQHTTYEGKDFNPAFSSDGTLYFLSDRDNNEMNLYRKKEENIEKLTVFDSSIHYFSITPDGSLIVFEKDYEIYTMRQTGKVAKVSVSLSDIDSLIPMSGFNTSGNVTDFDISGDGKKIVFVSRGLLFVSDSSGKYVKQLPTDPSEKVNEVKWLKDSETLIYSRTVKGWLNWFKLSAKSPASEHQITDDQKNNRKLSLNSDKTQGVYVSGKNQLMLMDLESFKISQLVEDSFWGFYGSLPIFSPDSRYVVYTVFRNFEEDIYFYDLKEKKAFPMAETGVSESSPFFTENGKFLVFTTDRTHPGYPRGTQNHGIYRLPLQKLQSPFKSEELREVFVSSAKDKKEDESEEKFSVSVNMDLSWVLERFERISSNIGEQYNPFVVTKDDTYTFLYLSSENGGKWELKKTIISPFEKKKTETLKCSGNSMRSFRQFKIVPHKDTLYTLIDGNIQTINMAKNSVKALNIDFSFQKNMKTEFTQMFYEVWANLSENFYDKNFHGTDWTAVREKYSSFLPFVTNRNDLRILLNDMLGELNASHMGFRSKGKEEDTYYSSHTLSTGIVFRNDSPYMVDSVLKFSPADNIEVSIKPGDVLIAVNGEKVDSTENREKYFSRPNDSSDIELTFKRGDNTRAVMLHTESSRAFGNRMYDRWIDTNQEMVDKLSDKKIAYIYMKDMGGDSLNQFLIEMTSEHYTRDALILDLRNNMGGNVHDAVLNFLSQKIYSSWKFREDKMTPQPNFFPASKPIVLLINKLTLSDGEMTAAGFKALNLGTVIGTSTYRWLIFTSGMPLVDGSYHRMPSWGCYTVDGKDIEMHGVEPDINVPLTVKDKHLGKDPQLERAVKEILKQL